MQTFAVYRNFTSADVLCWILFICFLPYTNDDMTGHVWLSVPSDWFVQDRHIYALYWISYGCARRNLIILIRTPAPRDGIFCSLFTVTHTHTHTHTYHNIDSCAQTYPFRKFKVKVILCGKMYWESNWKPLKCAYRIPLTVMFLCNQQSNCDSRMLIFLQCVSTSVVWRRYLDTEAALCSADLFVLSNKCPVVFSVTFIVADIHSSTQREGRGGEGNQACYKLDIIVNNLLTALFVI